MQADELEEVMTQFVNGEADVLLSTTIIESGLDIPNANTIIIDRADRFGLSDLYQLRGRVGRYKHQAYAYLLIPRHARMLTDARKRISAIKQYSKLGSGFKIAMRDLEIRGAGNLLGPQQSGHITAVGFDLYCQLLKQSISGLKGEKVSPRLEVEVQLDFLRLEAVESHRAQKKTTGRRRQPELTVNVPREVATEVSAPPETDDSLAPSTPLGYAYIPANYIPAPRQRIEIYRKLAEITEATSLDQLRDQVRDRFGPDPPPVELLLLLTEVRLLAGAREITRIETKGDKLMLTRHNDSIMLGGKFPRLTKPTAKARLGEIKRLLKTLPSAS
jgi:transcription-repair coupling factor (superfamily II helicase)